MNTSESLPTARAGYDVGVLGATSFVGGFLIPALISKEMAVLAVSRRNQLGASRWVKWASEPVLRGNPPSVPLWISLMPVGALPGLFPLLEATGVRRLVVLSTTSVYTKHHSSDLAERAAIAGYLAAEVQVREWAALRGIEWVILRPTMVYGSGRDINVARIRRFVSRFGFVPVVGGAPGLRQPVHAADIADACIAALYAVNAPAKTLTLSGGEVLSYAEMVRRIAAAAGCTPRMISFPVWMFRVAIAFVRLLPRYRLLSAAMAERMETDMVFPHDDAERVLGFRPRRFTVE